MRTPAEREQAARDFLARLEKDAEPYQSLTFDGREAYQLGYLAELVVTLARDNEDVAELLNRRGGKGGVS